MKAYMQLDQQTLAKSATYEYISHFTTNNSIPGDRQGCDNKKIFR